MKKNIKNFVFILLSIYIIMYIMYKDGYYYKETKEKTIMTEETIKKYEEDLKNNVDLKNKIYIDPKKDHSNNLTKASLKVSDTLTNIIDNTIKKVFKTLNKIVNE